MYVTRFRMIFALLLQSSCRGTITSVPFAFFFPPLLRLSKKSSYLNSLTQSGLTKMQALIINFQTLAMEEGKERILGTCDLTLFYSVTNLIWTPNSLYNIFDFVS
jgi:hypothetical protein